MTPASRHRSVASIALLTTLVTWWATDEPLAQRQAPAEGPWFGQAQCVVVAKNADYQDDQTHTWKLTGAPPTPAPRGSAQVYYTWPVTWSVQGSGRKTFSSRTPGATGRDEQTERWTIASEMNATLRITEIAGKPDRLRIGAEGQRGAPLGSIRVTEVSGRTRDAAVQPWPFPAIEDNATNTTISGSSTRTYPEGFGVGWGQPPKAITTATCTWSFTRGAVFDLSSKGERQGKPVSAASTGTPTGGRGRSTGGRGRSGAPTMTIAGSTDANTTIPNDGGLTVLDPTAAKACGPGPSVETAIVTPTSVTFAWRAVTGATGYVVADKNANPLTPAPITQLTYTHSAPHVHSYTYAYSVTALLASGGCGMTNVTVTPAKPLTPQVTARVKAGSPAGRVTLTWADQADRPHFYLVLGSGVAPSGVQVAANTSGHTYEVNQLPPGIHSWVVTPMWKAGDDLVGDDALGARVTAAVPSVTVGPSLARTIELPAFTGSGGWMHAGPRTIQLSGFTGMGTTYVGPRTITLDGWTATGPFSPIQGVIK